MNHIQQWAVGGVVAIALPFALKWAINKGIAMLKSWEMAKVKELFSAKTGDPALDVFEHDLIIALAKLAQAKFPKDGMGPERKKFLIDLLCNKIPWFKGQEELLGTLIDGVVAAQAEVLDSIH